MDEFVPYVEKRIRAKQMLFLIDCCFSGLVYSPQNEEYRRNMDPADMCKAAKRKSVQIYAAGGKDETVLAYSGVDPPISVFVESIKRVLSTINPFSYPEGFLSAFKLEKPVSEHIRSTSISLHRAQNPTYYFFPSDESGEFVFKQFSKDEIESARERPGAALNLIERFVQDSGIAKVLEYQNITAIGRALDNGFPDGYSLAQLQNTIDHIVNNTDTIVLPVREMIRGTPFTEGDILGYISVSILSMGLVRGSFSPRFVRLPSEAEVT